MYSKEYIKNMWAIRIMVGICLLSLIIFCFVGCTASKIDKGSIETTETKIEATNEVERFKKTLFDRTIIEENQEDYTYEPIDPSKEMEIRNEGGKVTTKNARKTYIKKKKLTNVNTEENAEGNKSKTENNSETKSFIQKWYHKIKVSIPWYFWVILMIGVIGFFALRNLFSSVSAIKKTLNRFNQNL